MSMNSAIAGFVLDEKGIPKGFKQSKALGTAAGELYVNPKFVTERTTKGFVAESELAYAFEKAEEKFAEDPKINQIMVDGFKFHSFERDPYIIYCLPFGVVYYPELDHE